jgi:HEAT repeat protein
VQPLLDAVDTTVGAGSDQATRATNRTNARIAEALGNIGDPRAGPTLLRLARATDDLVRLAAVQALGSVHFKEAVPELAHIVDDQAAPPLLVKKAIVSLGQIGDPGAIPALEHGLVLERQGVSFLPESSFALFLIGAPAVEPLMKIAQDQDPAYLAWARENNRAPAGTYAKAALVLGDLEDPRAVPVLLAKLKYTDPDPVPSTARLLTNLVREFAASALGRMRVKEAAAPIQALVSTKDADDEDLTTFSAEALVWIGDRAQARELIKKAQTGVLKLRLIAAQSAALFGEPLVVKDLLAIATREAKGSGANCIKQLNELNMPIDDPKQACDLLSTQFGDLSQPLEAAKVCSQDAPCWLPKLQDKDVVVRARAAYELGRIGAADAVAPLTRALLEEQLLVREAATRALDWLADAPAAKPALKSAARQIAAQLAAEQGKVQLVKVNEELRRLQVKLSRL